MKKSAVLLVGHGSRREEANEALVKLCRLMSEKHREMNFSYAYLQFAAPDLSSALRRLAGKGMEEVTVMPIFLYDGVHIHEDIPEILAREGAEHPQMQLLLAPVLGIDERMVEIIMDRIAERRAISESGGSNGLLDGSAKN